jgi:hypothetical protein
MKRLFMRSWTAPAATLPALGIIALPKCPLCVMLVLGALGLGHSTHDVVFTSLQVAMLGGVLVLALRRRPTGWRLAAIAIGASAMLLPLVTAAPDAVSYAGAGVLIISTLVNPRAATPSCACAPVPSPET